MNNFENIFSVELRRGTYSSGERLPSEPMLCEQYGFSRPTVHKGLESLIARGILSRSGRCVRVASNARQLLSVSDLRGKVTLIVDQEGYSNVLFYRLMELLMERFRGTYSIEFLVMSRENGNVLDIVDPESVVVLLEHFFPDGVLRQIHAKCRNVFLVNVVTKYGNWLLPDNYAAGRLVAQCLYENGHRKIGALLHTPNVVEFEERFRGIREYLAEHDVTAKRMQLPHKDYDRRISSVFFEEYVLNQSVTAVVCLHHKTALDFYDLAMEHGVAIPDDLSIIAFDDTYGTEFLRPPLTAVRYPVATIAEKIAQAIPKAFEVERGKTFLKETIPMTFMERDSVQAIRPESG